MYDETHFRHMLICQQNKGILDVEELKIAIKLGVGNFSCFITIISLEMSDEPYIIYMPVISYLLGKVKLLEKD